MFLNKEQVLALSKGDKFKIIWVNEPEINNQDFVFVVDYIFTEPKENKVVFGIGRPENELYYYGIGNAIGLEGTISLDDEHITSNGLCWQWDLGENEKFYLFKIN